MTPFRTLEFLSGASELLKLFKQRLRLFQIARVKPLSEPPVNRSKQFARFLHLALVAPEACEAGGGAQFIGLSLLEVERVEAFSEPALNRR